MLFIANIFNFYENNLSTTVLSSLYEQYIKVKLKMDSKSRITFDLREEKWMSLLKALSVFRLPAIEDFRLNYVPIDSVFVKMFSSNLNKDQKEFTFNHNFDQRLESSKYIKELKLAAASTEDQFYVSNFNFSVSDF